MIFSLFSIPFALWLMISSRASVTNCGPIIELKNVLLSTGTVRSMSAYFARRELGLSVMTIIEAPASCAISAVTSSCEE